MLENGHLVHGLFALMFMPEARHCIYQESSGLHISSEAPTQRLKSKQSHNRVRAVNKQPHCHLVPTAFPQPPAFCARSLGCFGTPSLSSLPLKKVIAGSRAETAVCPGLRELPLSSSLIWTDPLITASRIMGKSAGFLHNTYLHVCTHCYFVVDIISFSQSSTIISPQGFYWSRNLWNIVEFCEVYSQV